MKLRNKGRVADGARGRRGSYMEPGEEVRNGRWSWRGKEW